MIDGGSDREQAIANCFKQALLLFYVKIYNKFSYLKIITINYSRKILFIQLLTLFYNSR